MNHLAALGALCLLGCASVTEDPAPERWDPTQSLVPWAPPVWFPDPQKSDLWVLDGLDQPAVHPWGPRVNAHAGILADLDRGEILWARDPDAPRGMASVTKLFSSLALVARDDLDLDREVCVSYDLWPSRPGARSKFETDDCHAGWEYLGAALVASDNRGAFAFPKIAGQEYFGFLDHMGDVAQDLGIRHVGFGDPAGLQDENRASPRAVLKAITAVSMHPLLSWVSSSESWHIEPARGARRLFSTNFLLRAHADEYDTIAAKTGYTDTARYCFATVVRSRQTGRRYGAVVLAAPTHRGRFRDVLNMFRWADAET